jgi:cytokinin riboside 5'-monophosphate phosphoribohydrolase
MNYSEFNLSVCVFCASSDNLPKKYLAIARELGSAMATEKIRLVYGGGNNGMMGAISKEVHEKGGKITGVIPKFLKDMGYAYTGADEMIVTEDMRARKTVMESLSNGFICLAGGFGTLEEILEIITLKSLGVLDKPIVFLNKGQYFQGLFTQFDKAFEEKFIDDKHRMLYYIAETPEDALRYIIDSYKK